MDMSSILYDELVSACASDAVNICLKEADETPLEVGIRVGHTDLQKYGITPGILQTINENESTVEVEDGDIVTWETKGMVSIKRFNEVIEEGMAKATAAMREMIKGVKAEGDSDPISAILRSLNLNGGIGGPDLPTPGCECEHCASFSPEKHEEARALAAKMAAEEAAAAEAGTAGA